MSYDPNWLAKLRAKRIAKQVRHLTHISANHPTQNVAICGKGFNTGMPTVTFPSLKNLPGCRQCREKWLNSQGIEIDDKTGYPKQQPILN